MGTEKKTKAKTLPRADYTDCHLSWQKGIGAPTKLRELFPDIPEEMVRYLPSMEFSLFDLTKYTDEEVYGDIRLRLYFSTVGYVHYRREVEKMVQVFNYFAELIHQQLGKGYIDTVMSYIAQLEGVKEEDIRNRPTKEGGRNDNISPNMDRTSKKRRY